MEIGVPRVSPRPLAVANVMKPVLSLNGRWYFNPNPPADFEKGRAGDVQRWASIQVPGEWAMQGFAVPAGRYAAYWREFDVPADWYGNSIRLRFDAVQSDCRVWINGQEVGQHEGGFTVFELDVSRAVHGGRNTIALAVKNESTADVLASATQYAAHQLGGITRKVTLFALPRLHVVAQTITSTFDKEFRDAELAITLQLVNESDRSIQASQVRLELFDPAGARVPLEPQITALETIGAGKEALQRIVYPMRKPLKWDPEHPNLYTMRTTVHQTGKNLETFTQRFGFRQIEVRGSRLLVNNTPVKLHGVNRHETHPTLGRSLTADQWRRDVELFRSANINYIRTSHYPPAEEFLDACDELGVFVECEAALCWVQHGANETWKSWDFKDVKFYPYLLRANMENVVANRSHPAIIIWSLANESYWTALFAKVLEKVKQLDTTRATTFHDQCWGDYNNGGSRADIAVYHYPGEEDPARCDEGSRPTLFGEYAHIETYNRREVLTDPGIRDDWGRGFERMYDVMWRHDGCLGGAVWAGIDDIFYMPGGNATGYGPWGIIDGWRRAKPEYWHVKKTYSPARVINSGTPLRWENGVITVSVENRFDFSNLNEVKIRWALGAERGVVLADIPPHGKGDLLIRLAQQPREGQKLELAFTDPRGFECEREKLTVGQGARSSKDVAGRPREKLQVKSSRGILSLTSKDFACDIDRKTGQIVRAAVKNRPVLAGGPSLVLLPLASEDCRPDYRVNTLPLNAVCTEVKVETLIAATGRDGSVSVRIPVSYREAVGSYTITADGSGKIAFDYTFTLRQEINPRQWGIVLYATRDFDRLLWERNGQWNTYPEDHIGRLKGEAIANPIPRQGATELRREPAVAWSHDAIELGENDFRSTKTGVTSASLSGQGGSSIVLQCEVPRAIRTFADGNRTALLVAGFTTGGGDAFFAPHYAAERKPLKTGDTISDRVVLDLGGTK
jgi:beta-galactosidase